MNKEKKEIIGYIGALFLTITLIPQLLLSYKTKKVEDISFGFIGLQMLTCVFFLTYGILLKSTPLMLANGIVLTQLSLLSFLKVKYKNRV